MAVNLTETVKIRIDAETLRALEILAAEGDRTLSQEIRRVLRHHVNYDYEGAARA